MCKYNIFTTMNLDFLKERYSLQIWLLIMIVLISNLIFGLLAVFYINWAEPLVDLTNPDSFNNISLTSHYIRVVLGQLGTFLLPALVFAGLFSVTQTKYLQINWQVERKFWMAIFPVVVVSVFIMAGLTELNKFIPFPNWVYQMGEENQAVLGAFFNDKGVLSYLLNLMVLALLPAISEELIFRGVLQKLFIKSVKGNVLLGILSTAFLFSFIHFDFENFLSRFFMGIVLGYLMVWSRSVIAPIIAHFLNNALSISVFYYVGNANIENKFNWIYFTVSVLFLVAIVYRLKPSTTHYE